MSETVEKTITIVNKLGLHARAASQFVHLAGKFNSEVFISKGDQEVNGKSIMGILILAAAKGTQIRIRAEGEDAADALAALAELVENGFGED
ncbi:MAG: HPr family phosphocarrier protein [Thermodesulfobacteriota bacterium]